MLSSSQTRIFVLILLLIVFDFALFGKIVKKISSCSKRTIMNIVAHPDDDLLFLSPDLFHDINRGKCVISIFLTSGDAGRDDGYWVKREEGIKNAYSQMSNVTSIWVNAYLIKKGLSVYRPVSNPKISLIFLRLPDGNFKGTGYKNHNFETVSKLTQEKIRRIATVDGSMIYTKESLINTFLYLINYYQPDEIHTQDPFISTNQRDHADHYSAGYLTYLSEKKYLKPHKTIYYVDYAIESKPANISPIDSLVKKNAFLIYGQYDRQALDQNYLPWLIRQYKKVD